MQISEISETEVVKGVIEVRSFEKLSNHKRETVYSFIVFEELSFVVFSLSFNRKDEIRLFDLNTGNTRRVWKYHRGPVYHLLKWSEDTFISCADDGNVKLFSRIDNFDIPKSEQVLTLYRRDNAEHSRILRIDSDRLMVLDYLLPSLDIISFSKKTLLSSFPVSHVHEDTKIIKSLLTEHAVYVNIIKNGLIELIDYKEKKVLKKFNPMLESVDENQYINDICVYLNCRGEEILAAGGDEKILFFFHTQKNKLIKVLNLKERLSRIILHDRYLIIGDYRGLMRILDTRTENFEQVSSCMSSLGNGEVLEIIPCFKNKQLLRYTHDGWFSILKAPFLFTDDESTNDLKTRIEFLIEKNLEVFIWLKFIVKDGSEVRTFFTPKLFLFHA